MEGREACGRHRQVKCQRAFGGNMKSTDGESVEQGWHGMSQDQNKKEAFNSKG